MRLGQFVVAIVAVLLAGVAAERNRHNLLPLDDVENEERRESNNGAITSGRAVSVTTTAVNNDGGGTVTVATYNNNGLWQRIKRWWKKLIGYEERLQLSDRSSGIGPRVGTGGTVVISDNDKGGGTVTVTVFNNNGLFQKIKRWWKRIFEHEASRSARRLRAV
ncbi:hypothetical protein F441_10161 [Phytophthora nicotianae CJ01A1]|uniref:RxLR effector protein n=4 Tax=Phytophthora nicotianae TaxID=4792 RepID=W2RAE5_PHYN3|nr:hypothetical protein PPTG_01675 [Phytophthora nicotianae INRA-310]ETI45095.1 hypothetical protein F443_10226 [Phytophthora nicotianae P1569]ETK85070.1 hypothetical protein L915_10003 [Phytophthora nicotianae]ETP14912.1 hypothetical protein F441_10161 [Phytophthora nicotianae CJ01A1]ETL38495.1 hypothetical protein L916_09909 [Phytophthora nicotianae]ETM44907.1 hypothetical protein L914_09882 [Phytophthora nicotianae]